jgi:hypothetical protein
MIDVRETMFDQCKAVFATHGGHSGAGWPRLV